MDRPENPDCLQYMSGPPAPGLELSQPQIYGGFDQNILYSHQSSALNHPQMAPDQSQHFNSPSHIYAQLSHESFQNHHNGIPAQNQQSYNNSSVQDHAHFNPQQHSGPYPSSLQHYNGHSQPFHGMNLSHIHIPQTYNILQAQDVSRPDSGLIQNNPQTYHDYYQIFLQSQNKAHNSNSHVKNIPQPYNDLLQINSQNRNLSTQFNAQNDFPQNFPENYSQLYNMVTKLYPQSFSVAVPNNQLDHDFIAQNCTHPYNIPSENKPPDHHVVAPTSQFNPIIQQDYSRLHNDPSQIEIHSGSELNHRSSSIEEPVQTSVASQSQKMTEAYHYKIVRGLGITLIVSGILCMFFNAIGISYGNIANYAACGIWGGILFIVAGTYGVLAAKSKSRQKILAFAILCILSIFGSFAVLLAGIVGAVTTNPFDGGCNLQRDYYLSDSFNTGYPCQIGFDVVISMNSLQAIIAIVVLVAAIWGIKFTDYCKKHSKNEKSQCEENNQSEGQQNGATVSSIEQSQQQTDISSSVSVHPTPRPVLMAGIPSPALSPQFNIATPQRHYPAQMANIPRPAFAAGNDVSESNFMGHRPTLSYNSSSPAFGTQFNVSNHHGPQMTSMSDISALTFGSGYNVSNHHGPPMTSMSDIPALTFGSGYNENHHGLPHPEIMAHILQAAYGSEYGLTRREALPTVKGHLSSPGPTSNAGYNVEKQLELPHPAIMAHIIHTASGSGNNGNFATQNRQGLPHPAIMARILHTANVSGNNVENNHALPHPALMAHILQAAYGSGNNVSSYQGPELHGQASVIPSPPSNPDYINMLHAQSPSQA
jgi:hypothetical protein